MGFISLPVNFFLKFCPDSWAVKLGDEAPEDVEAARLDYEELRSKAFSISQSFKAKSLSGM